MSTLEYAAWAKHAMHAFGDFRTQQTLSGIGSMLSGLGGPSGAREPEVFAPWLEWPGMQGPSVEEQVASIDWASVRDQMRRKAEADGAN